MKRSLIFVILLTALSLCIVVGCNADKTASSTDTAAESEVLATWEKAAGSYVWQDSGQYTNKVLKLLYLDNGCLMFEFRLMEGSESEDTAADLVIPGVMLVDDKGVGKYENDLDAEKKATINFAISADGKQVTVTHTGELAISPDGVYNFTDSYLEVSEFSATSILKFLPTAATSLNSNNGAYTIRYPEGLVAGWFYPVTVTFNDTGAVLAQFLVAKDLSAVFRADDGIEPVLIFGSAKPMLSAEILTYPAVAAGSDREEDYGDVSPELQPVAAVMLEAGTAMTVGSSSKLSAVLPWKLPYTILTQSSDQNVLTVDKDGTVKAIGAGEAKLTGTLSVADGTKEFSFDISVTGEAAESDTIDM